MKQKYIIPKVQTFNLHLDDVIATSIFKEDSNQDIFDKVDDAFDDIFNN